LISLSPGWDITVPVTNGEMQPLCGVYAKSCLSGFEQGVKEGKVKLKELILQFRHQLVKMDTFRQDSAYLFQNLNTPTEFAAAIRQQEQ
jgi:molybdopterin-guanine dinucleotide biosynthesis protein A